MHSPERLIFEKYNSSTFLTAYTSFKQLSYISNYLNDIGAKSTIKEPNYFDRDYLSEFSEFYSTTAQDLPNICKRIHMFSSNIDQTKFYKALEDDDCILKEMQDSYLGFIVLRPIEHAPLGRTVLRWYPENNKELLRRTNTSRRYKIHIGGIELYIDGLAWQQQDLGISACATVALWTLLHSSAFDDFHYIPTTTEITLAANKYTIGQSPFPTEGLHDEQIMEAIKANGLTPVEIWGAVDDVELPNERSAFSKEDFAGTCAAFLRSGYPILINGFLYTKDLQGNGDYEKHTILAVGFREGAQESEERREVPLLLDSSVKYIYVHDDNLGPNVRFKISEEKGAAILTPSVPPQCKRPELFDDYVKFVPLIALAAINNGIRITADDLNQRGLELATFLQNLLREIGVENNNVSLSTRFVGLSEYLGEELPLLLENNTLGSTRRRIIEEVPPMSLYLGQIRFAVNDLPVFDLLCDTTGPNIRSFAVVLYQETYRDLITKIETDQCDDFGHLVFAFDL